MRLGSHPKWGTWAGLLWVVRSGAIQVCASKYGVPTNQAYTCITYVAPVYSPILPWHNNVCACLRMLYDMRATGGAGAAHSSMDQERCMRACRRVGLIRYTSLHLQVQPSRYRISFLVSPRVRIRGIPWHAMAGERWGKKAR